MTSENKTVPKTYNLRKSEIRLIEEIAEERGLSRSEIIRHAIQLYAITNQQLRERKRMAFLDEQDNATKLEVLWPLAVENRPTIESVKLAMWVGSQVADHSFGMESVYKAGLVEAEKRGLK